MLGEFGSEASDYAEYDADEYATKRYYQERCSTQYDVNWQNVALAHLSKSVKHSVQYLNDFVLKLKFELMSHKKKITSVN